ncbi:hypothetical protein Scep_002589 [Stephania cephalantha]|uniref:Uncharacterized protein n=1 Tax=Stephania cephalantha TaxID=152367 RepID=A0AAP0LA95_9MAGN
MATTHPRVLQWPPHPRVLLLHLRVASAVFADSLERTGQNRVLFADSPIRLLHQIPLRRFAI